MSESVPYCSVTSVIVRVGTGGKVVGDPGEIVRAEARAGDDVEMVVGETGDGEVAFDAAAGVEQLRVGQAADRLVDVVGGDAVERGGGVLAGDFVLGEGGLIEQPDGVADQAMFVADGTEPVLPAHRMRCRARSMPAGANQLGRSQPSLAPNTAPWDLRRS